MKDTTKNGVKCYWHYTNGDAFLKILKDGAIRPLEQFLEQGVRPVVWFSSEPFWEPTAEKTWIEGEKKTKLDMAAMHERCGLYRLGLSKKTAALSWKEYKRKSGSDPRVIEGFVKVSRNAGGEPREWRATFDEVPLEKCLRIERFGGRKWVDASEEVEARTAPRAAKALSCCEQEDPFDTENRAVPISHFEDPNFREEVKGADVILGWDSHRRFTSIFYGAPMLDLIASGAVGGQKLRSIAISFDSRTSQLEYLVAAVEVLKGSHCYVGEGEV